MNILIFTHLVFVLFVLIEQLQKLMRTEINTIGDFISKWCGIPVVLIICNKFPLGATQDSGYKCIQPGWTQEINIPDGGVFSLHIFNRRI